MRWLFLVLCGGCTPHLVSDFEEITGANWEAPENDWDLAAPPQDLVGEGFSVGQVPHDFRLMDQNGQSVALWQFYGSVIVLDISTMWCRPCQEIARHVEGTYQDYKDEGFMYLTLLAEDFESNRPDRSELNEWADNFGIVSAPVIQDGNGYCDSVEATGTYPAVLLIDRQMRVVAERLTPSDDLIRSAIEDVL